MESQTIRGVHHYVFDDGMTFNSTMDAAIGKIEVTTRRQGNSDQDNSPSTPGGFSQRDRRNLQNANNAFQF